MLIGMKPGVHMGSSDVWPVQTLGPNQRSTQSGASRCGGARGMLARPQLRLLASAFALVAGVALAQPLARADALPAFVGDDAIASDFSVLTYNVKGLPWPIASSRTEPLRRIGARLAMLRAQGRQPTMVVLQEAFTGQAKALGDQAGYRYQAVGPAGRSAPGVAAGEGSWYLGETLPAALDSGLVILSDVPIGEIRRAAFPTGACAGTDCLAAKGILVASVTIPGKGPVTVATTHLNSRAASGAPWRRTHVAYAHQADFIADFVKVRATPPPAPLIIAGDFNRGQRPVRQAALTAALGPDVREGLRERLAKDARPFGRPGDARWIRQHARDMQFVFDGARARLQVVGAEIPFGTESDGSQLSDHMGFTIHYRISPTIPG
jgi:endonuclease/exonuclease/phosphatase family metal-dependent hydrolase